MVSGHSVDDDDDDDEAGLPTLSWIDPAFSHSQPNQGWPQLAGRSAVSFSHVPCSLQALPLALISVPAVAVVAAKVSHARPYGSPRGHSTSETYTTSTKGTVLDESD